MVGKLIPFLWEGPFFSCWGVQQLHFNNFFAVRADHEKAKKQRCKNPSIAKSKDQRLGEGFGYKVGPISPPVGVIIITPVTQSIFGHL